MGILSDASERVLIDYVNDTVKFAQDNLARKKNHTKASGSRIKAKINNTGTLSSSLTGEVVVSDNSFTAKVTAKGEAGRYADIVELGRRKGKGVPIAPLRKWVEKKVRLRNADGQFKTKDEAAINSAAYLISRSIKKHGIKGRNYLKTASNKSYKKHRDELEGALFVDAQSAAKSQLNNVKVTGLKIRE